MTKERRTDIQIWSAIGMLIFGVGLTTAGFIIPPVGVISDSVLWVLAQCFIYAGSALGINVYIQTKFSDLKTEMRKQAFEKSKGLNPNN